ncbi:MAG: protein phosphatase 2C domain-containing protein [Pseudomonadota bacterium]|nr:protein phosphatase 2C domain-containing protein [Pseudomonadota bacterium]
MIAPLRIDPLAEPTCMPCPGVRSTARSHLGLVRSINEDRVFDCPERSLWAVVDGMGGHAGGEFAAQSVIDALRPRPAGGNGGVTLLRDALTSANDTIVFHNERLASNAGATAVALSIQGDRAVIAWVGDSRAYLVRGGEVRQLTRDHSVVQDLIDAGLLSPADAARHPHANVVTRAVGVDRALLVDTVQVDLLGGDRLLLCSDGLSRSLDGGDMPPDSIGALADRLLAGALARDGSDNISLVLIEWGTEVA